MEEKMLNALLANAGKRFSCVDAALEAYSPRELLDIWLHYEGIYGYTNQILTIMQLLGFRVCDKIADPNFMLLDAIVED